MTIENAALLHFMRQNCPEGYYTTIEILSTVSGRRAMVLLYTPTFNTLAILFPPNSNLDYAIYNGASTDQLEVRQISLLSQTSALPTSDASQWSSIWTEQTSQKIAESVIRTARLRNVPRTPRSIPLTKAIKDYVIDTVLELDSRAQEKKQRREMRLKMLGTQSSGSAASSQLGPQLSQKPRQVQIGKAWQEDKQSAMMVASMGMGGGAGAVAKSANTARGISRLSPGSLSATKGNFNFGRQTTSNTTATLPTSEFSPSPLGRTDVELPSGHSLFNGRPTFSNSPSDNMDYPKRAPNTISPSGGSIKAIRPSGYDMSGDHAAKVEEWLKSTSSGNFANRKTNLQAAWARATRNDRWQGINVDQARIGAFQNGGTLSSLVEGGINAGLAEQQHGFDKENLQQYFEGMTAQQKQEFLNQMQLMQEQGLITSEQMKQQFGFDIDKMKESVSGEKELMQEQAGIKEKEELRALKNQGLVVAQSAALPHQEETSGPPSVNEEVSEAPTMQPGSKENPISLLSRQVPTVLSSGIH